MTAAATSGGVGQRSNRSEGLVEGPALMAAHLVATAAGNAARVGAAALAKPKNQHSTINGRAYTKIFVFGLVAALSCYERLFPKRFFPRQAAEAERRARRAAERAALPGAPSWRRSSLPTTSPSLDGAGDEIDQLFFDPGDDQLFIDPTNDGGEPTASGSVVDISPAAPAAAAATAEMQRATGEGEEVDPVRFQDAGPLPEAVQPSHVTAASPMALSTEAGYSLAGDPDTHIALLGTTMDNWEILAQQMHDAAGEPSGDPASALDDAAGAAQAPPPSSPVWQTLLANVPPAAAPWVDPPAPAHANVTAVSNDVNDYQTRSATALTMSVSTITALAPSATASASATTVHEASLPRWCRMCLGRTQDRMTGEWRCCHHRRDGQVLVHAAVGEEQQPAADAAAEGTSARGV